MQTSPSYARLSVSQTPRIAQFTNFQIEAVGEPANWCLAEASRTASPQETAVRSPGFVGVASILPDPAKLPPPPAGGNLFADLPDFDVPRQALQRQSVAAPAANLLDAFGGIEANCNSN